MSKGLWRKPACGCGGCRACRRRVQKRDQMRCYRTGAPCRHCRRKDASRPRGLCWTCYHEPGVKEHYPPALNRYSRRGRWFKDGDPEPAAACTNARPGTPAKVAVLEARAEAGQELWHPEDAR